MRKMTALLASGVVLAITPLSSATAEEAPATPLPFQRLDASTPEKKTWKISKSEFEAARKSARSARSFGDEADKADKVRKTFLKKAAENGTTYAADQVDSVPLMGGKVHVAVPRGTTLDEINLTLDDGTFDVTAKSSSTSETDQGSPSLQADPSAWTLNGSGDYVINVTGVGDALFLWKRERLLEDGSATSDYYQYSRKASADPQPIDFLPDPTVQILRIQSYPYDEIESGLEDWVDLAPASDIQGNCDTNAMSVGVQAPLANAGYSFIDCDDYTVWRNVDKPGSYHMTMGQGLLTDGGSREAAYSLSIKVKEGTAGSMHDFNRVTFYWNAEDYECSEYDAGKVCP
ncbi:hypothetical protein ABZ252_21890 [Streptomyces sp. NPDC006175]|uniref:hypothetical protein n=1 Tax=Streptomyces sp. NPDC006175 TaxID=3154471 RepID=UPI0033B8B981